MKIRELLKELEECKDEYGKDFLEWDVYTEQCAEHDKKHKRGSQNWKIITDSDEWEYFECVGFWTKMRKEKIFTVNVNY